jgi:hypothetical protein
VSTPCAQGVETNAQEIWFNPGDDLKVKGQIGHPDYRLFFQEPSRWS